MSRVMGHHNVDESTQDKRHGSARIAPPEANLLAAANYVRNLFEGKKLAHGFMGEFEMVCLGHRRNIPNLQIAYDIQDFHRVKSKLEGDRRVSLPEGMNSLFPAKCIVRTGPWHNDEGCIHNADIMVDLVPSGCYGTPTTGNLAKHTVLLSLKIQGKLKTFKSLNMFCLLQTLVHSCKVRDLTWNPLHDVVFLCHHYAQEVQSAQKQLDKTVVQQTLQGSPFFAQLSWEDQRKCYRGLIGIELPPMMSITPATPLLDQKRSITALDVAGNDQSASQYSPHPRAPLSPALLGPPASGKLKVSPKSVSDSSVRPSEPPALLGNQDRVPVELSTSPRDSRARYRSISTPRISSPSGHPPPSTHTNAPQQPISVARHYGGFPQPEALRALSSIPRSRQNGSYVPASGIPRLHGAVALASPPMPISQSPDQIQNYTLQMSVTDSTTTLSLRQQYMSLQSGPQPGAEQSTHLLASAHKNNSQVQLASKVEFSRVELPGKLLLKTQARRRYRMLNAESKEDIEQSERSRSPSPAHELPASLPSQITLLSAQTKSNELKKTRPISLEIDTGCQIEKFIAELSAERDTPKPKQQSEAYTHQVERLPNDSGISLLDDMPTQTSPNSPYSLEELLETSFDHHQDIPILPLQPRTQSAPLGALPASLIAGPTHAPRMSQDINIPSPSLQTALAGTNASRYARYSTSTPPSSKPNSPKHSQYKAYQPPTMPLTPPLSISLPSPPPIPDTLSPMSVSSPWSPRRTSFSVKVMDVDGAAGYFRHRRDRSNDSSASGDSRVLAMEYQAELGSFEDGYGAVRKVE